MSKASNIIRRFNRFELKYLLSADQARTFEEEIKEYLHPDEYGDDGRYAISSLYYDTPKYLFYWEKVEGIKFRRKLRIRQYESQEILKEESPVFVEIKQRLNRVTQKRRVVLSYKDALTLCDYAKLPKSFDKKDLPVIEEIQDMVTRYNLQPSAITSYFRKAYSGNDLDMGLRVTFDSNLRYRTNDIRLESKKIGEFMLPPDAIVMEIKANERVPYWLTELVGEHNLRLIRVSKYCQGLEVAERVPKSKFFLTTSS